MRYSVKYFIALTLCFILITPPLSFAESNSSEFLPRLRNKEYRILKQPNGPFAVMVFDEYALGLNIGVIYYEQMGIPKDGNWWLSERFWSDRLWSSNVTSILWGPNSQFLYVATSRIYGDGSVFRLNLKDKSAKKIFPVDDINATDILMTEITGFNTQSNKIGIRVTSENKKKKENIEIPLN